MSLNYVTLTFTEQDAGQGASAGPVVIAPTARVVAAGQTVVSQQPVTRQLGGGTVSVQLVACDNAGTTPAAGFWAYNITLPGDSAPGIYLVNFANGATQQFANLTPVVAQTTYGPAAGSAGFQNPMTTFGDLIYEDATPKAARLAGDTSNIRKFVRGLSVAGVAQAPAWDTITPADISAAFPWQFYVDSPAYGAKGNGKVVADGAMTSASNVLACTTSTPFTSTAVDGGKTVIVNNAGAGNLPLVTTISTVTDSGHAVLAANASSTVTGAPVVFGSDDTAAVNAAVTAAAAYAVANDYYAQVVLSPKIYMLASGPTQTGDGATTPTFNSQVPLPYPAAAGTSRKLIIELAGPGESSACQYWESTVPNLAGAVLLSTLQPSNSINGTFGRQSVIGGPTGSAGFTGGYANTKVVLRNITVAMPVITNSIAFDLSYVSAIHVDGCSAQVFCPVAGSGIILPNVPGLTSFQSTISIGLRCPVIGNNDDVVVTSFAVEGYETGVRQQDHPAFGRLATIYCDLAVLIDLTAGASGVSHAVTIENWSCEAVNGALKSNGSTYCMVNIGALDMEQSSVTYDISDTGNSLYGVVHWTDQVRSVPTITGAANLAVINDKLGPGNWSGAPAVPGSTTPQQNTAWRPAAVSIKGGTVTAVAVDGATVATATGTTVIVPPGKNITLTYSAAPTWAWTLL